MATTAFLLLVSGFFLVLGRTTAGAHRTPWRRLGLRGAWAGVISGMATFSRLSERRAATRSAGRSG